jgi:LysM repeat protein
VLLALACGGCPQEGQNQSADEEKEPHFIEGSRHVNEMDYPAAIESFEKALSVNRNSARAHWELAALFESRVPDPAAAIYHYERFLKLRPNSGNAETVRQHILACKQDLARTVSLGPVTEKVQRDLERLIDENRRLTAENKRLNEEVQKAYAVRQSATAPSGGGAVAPVGAPSRSDRVPVPPPPSGSGASSAKPPASATSPAGTFASGDQPRVAAGGTPRSHTVQPHETLGSIARQEGVKLEALKAANPGLDPRRLRPGQKLVMPR